MELNECIPNVTRVRAPRGDTGTVIRVSARLRTVLVKLDAGGGAWSFRPGELTTVEPVNMQNQTRPWP